MSITLTLNEAQHEALVNALDDYYFDQLHYIKTAHLSRDFDSDEDLNEMCGKAITTINSVAEIYQQLTGEGTGEGETYKPMSRLWFVLADKFKQAKVAGVEQ